MLCVRAHSKHLLYASSRFVQFAAVASPYVSRLTSSAKPSGSIGWSGWWTASSSGVL